MEILKLKIETINAILNYMAEQPYKEVINIIAVAMRLNAPYQTLGTQIFTHPTMAEALNDLFA